jgi:hypothetical protein
MHCTMVNCHAFLLESAPYSELLLSAPCLVRFGCIRVPFLLNFECMLKPGLAALLLLLLQAAAAVGGCRGLPRVRGCTGAADAACKRQHAAAAGADVLLHERAGSNE